MSTNKAQLKDWNNLKPEEQSLFRDPDKLAEFILAHPKTEETEQSPIETLINSMTKDCKSLAIATLNRVIMTRLLNKKPVPLDIIKGIRAKLGNASCAFESYPYKPNTPTKK